MAASIAIDVGLAQRFALVLARVAGVVGFAPVLGGGNVPRPVKVGLALSITLLLSPHVAMPVLRGGLLELAVAIGGEVLIGALIGFVVVALFAAVQLAGQSIGIQMGFAAASQFDPTSQSSSVVIAQFQFVVATLLFFALDGHHRAIEALAVSFTRVPLLHAQFSGGVMELIFNLTAAVFVAANERVHGRVPPADHGRSCGDRPHLTPIGVVDGAQRGRPERPVRLPAAPPHCIVRAIFHAGSGPHLCPDPETA